MINQLQALRETLVIGIRLSKQGSYQRRAPAQAAMPYLMQARAGLRELTAQDTNNVEAWRLLSQAEECLLNYREALACLDKAMALSSDRRKTDLKRAALLKESIGGWESLEISPERLQALGEFLARHGVDEPRAGASLKFTLEWLSDNNIANPERVVRSFEERGARTDFQVLYNIVRG